MSITTIFAHVSCSDLEINQPWYEKLFGRPPIRKPMAGLVEWRFTESAEFQLYEQKAHAGHNALTLGVTGSLEQERQRLLDVGLQPNLIEEAEHHFLMCLHDPDENLVVFAQTKKPD